MGLTPILVQASGYRRHALYNRIKRPSRYRVTGLAARGYEPPRTFLIRKYKNTGIPGKNKTRRLPMKEQIEDIFTVITTALILGVLYVGACILS
jgi:hypothetical protein